MVEGQLAGPLIVKGIQSVPDALKAVEMGADALIVSNHGVGDSAEVYVDGGIISGADIAAAFAVGARAAMVGRAYLYGLMAGGQVGVTRSLGILAKEYHRTLQLLGVTSTEQLHASSARMTP